MPVAEYRGKKVILVNRGGKWYIRAYPEYEPTENQLRARRIFAEAARRARGKRFRGDVPPAAEEVKKAMKGLRIGHTPRPRKWEIALALAEMQLEEDAARRLIEAYEKSSPYVVPYWLRRLVRDYVRNRVVETILPAEEREERLIPPRGGYEKRWRLISLRGGY